VRGTRVGMCLTCQKVDFKDLDATVLPLAVFGLATILIDQHGILYAKQNLSQDRIGGLSVPT
jgi:hypothetical protein